MKRLPRWKSEQADRRRRRFGKVIYLLFLLMVSGFLIILFAFFFLNPFLSGFQSFDRFNVVIAGKDFTVLSISTSEKTATVIDIPASTLVSFPAFSTRYRIGALPQLDSVERKNGRLVLNGITMFLGLPVEKWFIIKDEKISFKSPEDVKSFFSYRNLKKNSERLLSPTQLGNLSFLENVQLSLFIESLRPNMIEIFSLSESSFLRDVIFADGSVAKEVDSNSLDYFLKESFIEKHFLSEQLMIEVRNATGIAGQAIIVQRLLTNMGGDVINVTKMDDLHEGTIICVKSSVFLKSYTVRRVANIFLSKVSLCSEEDNRADITIMLGRDYFFRWN